MKKISIVSPCYNEEDNVENCYETVKKLMSEKLGQYSYEHVFADNNSSDNTVNILRELAQKDENVKVVVNARNYGPFRSTFNALKYTQGDGVLVMLPVDLQDPPELLETFVKYWEEGYLKVYGVREERQESRLMRFIRGRYYKLVSRFANINIPLNTAEFQLLDRQVIDSLLQYQDYYPYIRGMIANVGFDNRAKAVPYKWKERKAGISKNRLYALIDQALNGIISFTNVPMRLGMFLGVGLSAAALFYSAYQLIVNILSPNTAQPGIVTLIVALFFFSGIQFLLIGIIGEYISAIHSQVRHKDIVVEQELMNLKKENKFESKE